MVIIKVLLLIMFILTLRLKITRLYSTAESKRCLENKVQLCKIEVKLGWIEYEKQFA